MSLFRKRSLKDCKSLLSDYLLRFKHQIVGITWLWESFKEKKGCILADDMGLGKTVQVIFPIVIYLT